MNPTANSPERPLAILTLFCVLALLASSVRAAEDGSFDKYQTIIKRSPFGTAPRQPTDAEIAAALAKEAESQNADEPQVKLADTVRLSAISKYQGILAAGFYEKTTNKSFLLREGETLGDFTLKKVNLEQNSVLLTKGDLTEEIVLSFAAGQATNIVENANTPYLTVSNVKSHSLSTNSSPVELAQADDVLNATEAEPVIPSAPVFSPDMIAAATSSDTNGEKKLSFRELHRLRVLEMRQKTEAERQQREAREKIEKEHQDAQAKKDAEQAALTAKLEAAADKIHRAQIIKAIKDGYAVDIDFELTPEEAKDLAKAGFAIPDDATTPEAQ